MFTLCEPKASEKTSLLVLFTVMSPNNNLGTPIDLSLQTMPQAFITKTWSNGTYNYALSNTAMYFPPICGINSNRNFATVIKENFLSFLILTFTFLYQERHRYIYAGFNKSA
jgi:hypothetical protein